MSSKSEDLRDEDLEVDELPTVEPYEELGIDKTATPDKIKSAYRKAALRWHPDKAKSEDKATAHTKFQSIAFAYAILSDSRRRSLYDSTGRTSDSLDLDDDTFDWSSFYRAQFADVISSDSIAAFTAEYKNSDEEREALLAAYTATKGNMTKVYEEVMVSNPAEDDARFRAIIKEAIEKGEVKGFERFVNESQTSIDKRIAKAKSEGTEAEEYAKEIGVHEKLFGNKTKKGGKKGGEDALAALIQQRQKGRGDDFLAGLEAKYASKGKKGKKRAEPMDEPPEEAFEKNAKKKTKKGKA